MRVDQMNSKKRLCKATKHTVTTAATITSAFLIVEHADWRARVRNGLP